MVWEDDDATSSLAAIPECLSYDEECFSAAALIPVSHGVSINFFF